MSKRQQLKSVTRQCLDIENKPLRLTEVAIAWTAGLVIRPLYS